MKSLAKATFLATFLVLSVLPIYAWGTDGTLNVTSSAKLTENHNGNIIIEADGITLNCNGHTVSSVLGTEVGIDLTERTGVTVKNCRVQKFIVGINVFLSSNNIVKNNVVTESDFEGIFLDNSSGNIVKNNVLENNYFGISLDDDESVDNTIKNNTASGNDTGFNLESAVDNKLKNNTANENEVGFNPMPFS